MTAGDVTCVGRARVVPASEQTVVLEALKEEVGVCNSCCETAGLRVGACGRVWRPGLGRSQMPPLRSFPGLRMQAQLKTASTELGEAQGKLIQQESALKELSERGEDRAMPRPLIPHHTSPPTLESHTQPSVTQTYLVILTSNPDRALVFRDDALTPLR